MCGAQPVICLNHKLELLFSSAHHLTNQNLKIGRGAMLVAFEINFALWVMIGCGIAEAAQIMGF